MTEATDSKLAGLLARALHPTTPPAEATNCFGRILANPEWADAFREQCSTGDSDLQDRYNANARELRRAIAEIARLRTELEAFQGVRAGDHSDDQNGRGREREDSFRAPPPRRGGFRRPRPVVEIDSDATCSQCGADLPAGSSARIYPGGRVYGTECHGRRARA